jgi:hypothetical protein
MAEEFTEKERRIYYQSIVYRVCSLIDRATGRNVREGTGTMAGTVESPSDEVVRSLEKLLKWQPATT